MRSKLAAARPSSASRPFVAGVTTIPLWSILAWMVLTGVGSVFNVLNFGQMLMWHILLLPLLVGFVVAVHILQVRRRGVVPPIDAIASTPDVESTADVSTHEVSA